MRIRCFILLLCIPLISLQAADPSVSATPLQISGTRIIHPIDYTTLNLKLSVFGGAQLHRLDFKGIEFDDQVLFLSGIFPQFGVQLSAYSTSFSNQLSVTMDLSYGPIKGAYEYFDHTDAYLRYHHFEYEGGKLITRFGLRYHLTTNRIKPYVRGGLQLDNLLSLKSYDDYYQMNRTTGTTFKQRDQSFLIPKKFWYGIFAGVGFDWQLFPKNSLQLEALVNVSQVLLQHGNTMQTAQITVGYLL